MKRFLFLDWMRGLAVLIMIPCHTFNSFARVDARGAGAYIYSQFVGGMAAPLFLFMAGMTLAFQMESLDRREPGRARRWLGALRRAGYVWGIACLFRLTNWAASWPNGGVQDLTRVDILNCMGFGMAVLAVAAAVPFRERARFGAVAGLIIAAAAPVVANLDWSGVAKPVRDYFAAGQGGDHFAFFPCAAYVAFGLAAGTVVKAAGESLDRLMQWCAAGGFVLVVAAQYFSNTWFSVYPKSDFWTDSPALILIRLGICLLTMAGAYVWTEYCVEPRWSWMRTLGRTSLMVYWVHAGLVYGRLAKPFQSALDIPRTALATLAVIALMVGLAEARLRWSAWRTARKTAAA